MVMLNHSEKETLAGIGFESTATSERTGLKALAADLPPELDAYLKKLIDSAAKRTSKSGVDLKHLLSTFAAGAYTVTEFENTLDALDTSRTGPTSQSHLCAWLLGVPLLREQDRTRAAGSLHALLRKGPKSLLMPAGKRMIRALRSTGVLAAALAMFPWIASALLSPPVSLSMYIEGAAILSLILYPVVLFYLGQREIDDAGDLRFIAAHALGRLRATAAIDALSVARLEGNDYLSRMATASLRVVLPHLTPEHYGQLGSDVVPNLCRLYKQCAPLVTTAENSDYRFALELLGALDKIGDARAIPVVQQSAHAWKGLALADAANRTLTSLEERKRRETERGTLLRGAGLPAIAEGELLRAATSQAESRPEQLLRPID